MNVLGINGSLRRGSYNRMALRYAATLLPDGASFQLYDGLKWLPAYDEDDDTETAPAEVAALRAAIGGADAVLFATPEYNGSIPGQLKNAIDWASRPWPDHVLRNKPVAVLGASTGAFGAVWAQAELRKALAIAGARVVGAEVPIHHADQQFSVGGTLIDRELADRVEELVSNLAAELQNGPSTPLLHAA